MTNKFDQSDQKKYVELTATGPILTSFKGEILSINSIERFEVDNATWKKLQEVLQTGELDNAKVKEIIGIK